MKQDYRICRGKIGERKAVVVCLKTVLRIRWKKTACDNNGRRCLVHGKTAPPKLPVLLSRRSTASSLIRSFLIPPTHPPPSPRFSCSDEFLFFLFLLSSFPFLFSILFDSSVIYLFFLPPTLLSPNSFSWNIFFPGYQGTPVA